MRNCFVCTTPYQILAVLSMSEEISETSDLYIVNQFSGADKLAARIKQMNIFSAVIYVNEDELYNKYNRTGSPFFIRVGLVHIYKDIDKIVEQFIENETEYDHVYVSTKCLTGRLLILYLYKHYGVTLFSYFDDGIGSYCDNRSTKTGFLDDMCRKIFITWNADCLVNNDWYLYNPDLFYHTHKKVNQPVYKIKFMDCNKRNVSLVCRIFGLEKIGDINEKVIVLDSLKERELTEEGIFKIEDLFNVISHKIGENELIFKAHPRDKTFHTEYKYLTYDGDVNLPFEIYGMEQDLSNKVLITNMSTAVFSPKLVFDQEPTIIFLFKILQDYVLRKTDIEKVVYYFKKIYNDSSKIFIPETKEELSNILEHV